MAGIGFVVFIAPPLAGIVAGLLLLLVDRLRFLAAYACCAPLCGAIGGWYGLYMGDRLSAHGFILAFAGGYGLGIAVGVLVSMGVNRLAAMLVA